MRGRWGVTRCTGSRNRTQAVVFPSETCIMSAMRKHLKVGIGALACLLVYVKLQALTSDSSANRYQAIADRNAFGLKPPPAIETPPPTPPQLPKLILTGITTILGDKRALLKALPLGTRPGQAAKEESLILAEGQREGNVEVLNIDENAGSVRVNNSGTLMTLTFEKDGAKLPSPPASPTNPPALPTPTNANLAPGATLPTAYPTQGQRKTNPNLRSLPARDLRSSQPAIPLNGGTGSPPPLPGAVPAALQLPQDLTPEEQAIVQELQRQAGTLPSTSAIPQAPVPGVPVPTPQNPVLPQ